MINAKVLKKEIWREIFVEHSKKYKTLWVK